MWETLTPAERKKRAVEWYNWKREVPRLRAQSKELRRKNRVLEATIRSLTRTYEAAIEELKLRVEQLSIIIFGRQEDEAGEDAQGGDNGRARKKKGPRKPRPPSSFRRPRPKPEEVTQRETHGVSHICPRCGGPLRRLATVIRYLEDIVAWLGEGAHPLKTVTEQRIETAECPRCRRRFSAIPIAKQVSVLGENVRSRIVAALTVGGQTWEQVARDLKETFGVMVSHGEINAILRGEALALLPEFHAIGTRIRDAPANHKDETSWPVQREGQGDYAWVETASEGPDTRFLLGRSRGKGNVKELQDGHEDQPTVTDDYAAYDDLRNHGLCWAHPKRKFKDLAASTVLPAVKKRWCKKFYGGFCRLYRDVATVVGSPYEREARRKDARRFASRIERLMRDNARDPRKLATWKASFLEHIEEYLFCVREPHVPMTNNKAERELRGLVVKRKVGFGSRTQRGADTMSVLLSVCQTIKNRHPASFAAEYRKVKERCRVMRA